MPARTVEAEARLRAKNQLTLPEPIAAALDARPDDMLVFEADPQTPGMATIRLIPRSFAGTLTGMYGTTEELWFVEWEFGGTPYKNPDLYTRWAPLMSAGKFKTPMLIIHGQLDFRVDVSEGFQIFTALQRQGVKSKMLYFPDEGHWVMKPANAELWYKTVLDWIDENTK